MTTRLKSGCKAGILVAACVSLAICSSCSDEEVMNGSGQSDKLSFGVSLSNEWKTAVETRSTESRQTRYETFRFGDSDLWIISSEEDSICNARLGGQPNTRAAEVGGDNFYQSFGVYGYVFDGSGTWEDNQTSAQLYMNGKVTQGTDVWTTASTHFWPGSRYSMKFFAYAPYDILTTATVSTSGKQPLITYEVPKNATEQVDLLLADEVETVPATDGSGAEYAETVAGNYDKPAKLHFYHALTAIKVKAVGDGLKGTIKKVELKGVKGTGTHLFGSDSWTLIGDDVNFSQTLDKSVGADTEGTMIIDGETTFMMIPQTLGENAALQITFSDGTVLTGSLSGKEWLMGKTVVYRVSRTEIVEEPYFTVTPVNTQVSYSGGTCQYEVKSYIKRIVNGKETIVAAPWEITGYQEEGSEDWQDGAPAWLSMSNTGGNGVSSATSSETRSAVVTAQSERVANPQNDALKNAEELTGVYDLSTRGNTVAASTANCYIVNAAGTYSLPLVYGNAIKDGNTNETAYNTSNKDDRILRTFINHLGREISSPYIYENKDGNGNSLSPEKATLIWQDVQNLVTDVQLSSDKKNLTFTVGKSTIRQGNAVVAIRDAKDRVMWSWHIWVTDYNPYAEATSGQHFFTRYVGWCYNDSHIYDPRKVKLHFKQTGTDKTAELEITQTKYIIEDGNNPYYQFGRKDPQLPATTAKSSATDKTWYDAEDTERTNIIVAQQEWDKPNMVIVNGILNPNTFCCVNQMDEKYLNLWSANNTNYGNENVTISVKTVYDPSPAGYKVPAIGLLSKNYTSISKSLYKSGYRKSKTGVLTSVGTEFDVFSCSPSSASSGKGYYYEIYDSATPNSCDAGHGGAICPVSE